MGKNPKVLIALVVILVVAVLGYVNTGSIVVGAGIAIVGVLAVVVVLRRLAVGAGESRTRDRGFLEADDDDQDTAQPLATWELPTRQAVKPEEIVWDDSGLSGDGLATGEPLDAFTGLDDLGGISEVEPLEAWDSGTDWDSSDEWDRLADDTAGEAIDLGPMESSSALKAGTPELEPLGGEVIEVNFDTHVVNEDVESADDIMAASQATELAGEPDNSELARLLAKVQARLAAYE